MSSAESSPDGIKGHVFVTKTKLQVGGYRQWVELERDGIRQVYLAKARDARMKTSPAFNSDMWSGLVRCAVAIRLQPVMELRLFKVSRCDNLVCVQ